MIRFMSIPGGSKTTFDNYWVLNFMISVFRIAPFLILTFMALAFSTLPVSAKNSNQTGNQEGDALPLAAGMCANRASAFIEKKDYAAAVKELELFQAKAATVDAETADKKGYTHYYLDFMLGNCCMMMENQGQSVFKKAAAAYERAVKKFDGLYQGWLNLGMCRYNLKQMDKAAHAFIKGYDTAPEKKAVYLYQAAACYYYNSDYQNSLTTFNRLMKSHPTDVTLEWKEVLVNILFALKKNREALPWLEELAAKSKGDKKKTWQEMLLYQYMELGMDKKALAYARQLTRETPEEPKWWKALAHIHLEKNRMEKGLEAFMIYSFTTPLSVSETKLLADLYAGCNIPLEAARVYEAWIEKLQKDPKSQAKAGKKKMTDRFLAIARAYQQGKDDAAAVGWADKGLAQGGDARLLEFKADILFGQKKYKAAYTAYKDLAAQGHSTGRSWLMAGYSALSCENLDGAKNAFTFACKHPKEKKAAASALKQVKAMQAAAQM